MPRGRRRTRGARRGRPTSLSKYSTAELRRELEMRHSKLQDLLKQRDALSAELQELESAFGPVGANTRRGPGRPPGRAGRPRGRGRGRNKNATNLVEALRGVLTGNTLSVIDAAEAVKKAGYQSSSENFRTIVNQALLANGKVFRKVARGQYTAR